MAAYNCAASDWLGCTIVLLVTQRAKTYVFSVAFEDRLSLPSFFGRVGSNCFALECHNFLIILADLPLEITGTRSENLAFLVFLKLAQN